MNHNTVTLTIELQPQEAQLLEKVARLRLRPSDGEAVNLETYIRQLLATDVNNCIAEIQRRRS